jgi:hypothetical protein
VEDPAETVPGQPIFGLAALPNPFNPRTSLRFSLGQEQPIELAIYDLRGRLLRRLAAGKWNPGIHQVAWDGCDERGQELASGIYLARLTGEGAVDQVKLVLVR